MKTMFKKVSAAVMALAVMSTAAALVFNEPETIAAETPVGGCTDKDHSGQTEWKGGEFTTGVSYYLDDTVTLSKEIEISTNVTLCLNGNIITAAKGSHTRMFKINSGGSLTICDCSDGNGKITGGAPTENDKNGGAVYVNGGTFTLEGGTISDNNAENNGGAVYIHSGKFTMNGGKIDQNTAGHEGGGVYVCSASGSKSGGEFIMNDGTISNNETTCLTVGDDGTSGNGGGVYTAGTFTMNNGEISGNIATGNDKIDPQNPIFAYGGGLCVNGGTTTMLDGKITGNTSEHYGGGVCVGASGTFDMRGGTINENTADRGGGGICFNKSDNATLRLDNKVCITPNYKSEKRNADIYLTKTNTEQKKITIGADFDPKGQIGIQTETHPTCTSYVDVTMFDKNVPTQDDISSYFKSDDSKYYIVNKADNTVQLAAPHNPKLNKTTATCTEPGIEEYWQCDVDVCHKYFKDKECKTEIQEPANIAALGHDYGEWEVIKEATYTEKGEEQRVCSRDPEHVETRAIPMLSAPTPVPPASDYSAPTGSAPVSSDDSSSGESSTPAESNSPGESSSPAESNAAENSGLGENNVANDAPYTGAEISILPIAACVAAASAAIAKRSKENK